MEGNESHQFIDLIFPKLFSTFASFLLVKKKSYIIDEHQGCIKVESSTMFVPNSFIDVSFIDKQRPLNTYVSWGWYVIASRAQINFINTFWYIVYFFQLWYKNVKEICWKNMLWFFLILIFFKKNTK